jgi:soluble lytic murein transglycosylase-like protein
MKLPYLFVTVLFVSAVSSFGQENYRSFDNFDTSRGVKIHYPAAKLTSISPAPGLAAKKNTSGNKLVRKTSISRMGAEEGLANAHLQRAGNDKLTMGNSSHLKGFTTGDSLIDSFIVDSSRRYSIDPLLIYAQMHQESSFKLRALSYKGASGLMQLMPATARRLGVTNIYDPKQNIDGGVKYMRMLLDMFGGDVRLALAGYNAGEGAVMKYGGNIPPYSETREYVRRITTRYSSISDPSIARAVPRINKNQAAKLIEKESRPLSVYEPNAFAVRLADGKMRLINQ